MAQVSKIQVNNLKESVLESVNQIGGFNSFLKENEIILLKPNFNTADPFPASSDLEFLKTVVELVLEVNPKKIIIGESSAFYLSAEKVMKDLNVFQLEEIDSRIEIHNFENHNWIKKEIEGAKYLKKVSVPELLDSVDKLVLLPCLKTHSWAQFTGALKLSVGFIKPIERNFLHLRHLQEKIGEMNKLINPDLIIMDGRKCFITKGPSEGEIREPNLILASTDRIGIDIEGIKIIQTFPGNDLENINPEEMIQIRVAREHLTE